MLAYLYNFWRLTRLVRICICLAVYALCLFAPAITTASAQSAPQPRVVRNIDKHPYVLWRETWAGGEMLARSWSLYTGSTVALTGDIEDVGWRLRSNGGYGRYTYQRWIQGLDGPEYVTFTGHKAFSDLMLGYHFRWQRLTLKAFGGVATEQHGVIPLDPENMVTQFAYGGKAALEAWLSISDHYWIAAEASWASVFDTYKVGLRSGYRLLDDLDVGLEARFEGNDAYEAGRAGGFVTMRFGDIGITASGGFTGDRDMRSSHYAGVNLFLRY